MIDRLQTLHGELSLPTFLPDATRGVVRGLDSSDVEASGVSALMMNSFHLSVRPGTRLIQQLGGSHAFAGWRGPIFADSGGFQVFSLIRQNPAFGSITNRGATFRLSPQDKKRNLTPEKAIQMQLQLGADVVTCLDDCTAESDPYEEQVASVARTVAWAAKCKAEFERLIGERRRADRGRPLLFAVIQGGSSRELRKRCAEGLLEIGFDGYGLGGWPLDEQGSLLVDVIGYTASLTPNVLPRHALGIGKPENVVACARLGYVVFDCAIPTRDARHQRLYVFAADRLDEVDLSHGDFYRNVYIQDQRYRTDSKPLSAVCDCLTCTRYSRAYLHHLYDVRDNLAYRLGTIHNLRFYTQLMELIRRDGGPRGARAGSTLPEDERAADHPAPSDEDFGG